MNFDISSESATCGYTPGQSGSMTTWPCYNPASYLLLATDHEGKKIVLMFPYALCSFHARVVYRIVQATHVAYWNFETGTAEAAPCGRTVEKEPKLATAINNHNARWHIMVLTRHDPRKYYLCDHHLNSHGQHCLMTPH